MFIKWPFVGMLVETFGFLNLFGYVCFTLRVRSSLTFSVSSDFFPVIVTFLRQVPFVGTALSLPYIREVSTSTLSSEAKLTPCPAYRR